MKCSFKSKRKIQTPMEKLTKGSSKQYKRNANGQQMYEGVQSY